MEGLFLCDDWGATVKAGSRGVASLFKEHMKQRLGTDYKDGDFLCAVTHTDNNGGNTTITQKILKAYVGSPSEIEAFYFGVYFDKTAETQATWKVYKLNKNALIDNINKESSPSPYEAVRPSISEKNIVKTWCGEEMMP